MRFFVLPSVNVAVIEKDKVLLSRRANTGWMDGRLCLPGGHVEAGETPRQAAVRELKEELGIDVHIDELELICVAARNTKPDQYVAYEFSIKDKGLEVTNAEPEKCSELVWSMLEDLPDDLIGDFREIIEQGLIKGDTYLELGF